MKRVVVTSLAGYLVLALVGHRREQTGSISCECSRDCWCKTPARSVFRWVFPFGHRIADPAGVS